MKLYTLFRTERTKTIPCSAAHPRIGLIREYSPPPPGPDWGGKITRLPTVLKNLFLYLRALLDKITTTLRTRDFIRLGKRRLLAINDPLH